jgi:hypothetical protein
MCSKIIGALVAVALCTAARGAAEGWSVIKSGMNRAEAASALGDPLFKNVGRGFEVWLYDGGAELLCYRGLVVAWTAPFGVASSDGRQLDLRPFLFKPAADTPSGESAVELGPDLAPIPIRQMRLPKI